MSRRASQTQAAATSFLALFSIVGLALYGLPLYYDFMVREFGWSRTQVTSGNALSKLVIGPLFGFLAGWIIDRFGPRRIMLVGILLAGGLLAAGVLGGKNPPPEPLKATPEARRFGPVRPHAMADSGLITPTKTPSFPCTGVMGISREPGDSSGR